jgi:hypothetical protein
MRHLYQMPDPRHSLHGHARISAIPRIPCTRSFCACWGRCLTPGTPGTCSWCGHARISAIPRIPGTGASGACGGICSTPRIPYTGFCGGYACICPIRRILNSVLRGCAGIAWAPWWVLWAHFFLACGTGFIVIPRCEMRKSLSVSVSVFFYCGWSLLVFTESLCLVLYETTGPFSVCLVQTTQPLGQLQ